MQQSLLNQSIRVITYNPNTILRIRTNMAIPSARPITVSGDNCGPPEVSLNFIMPIAELGP